MEKEWTVTVHHIDKMDCPNEETEKNKKEIEK